MKHSRLGIASFALALLALWGAAALVFAAAIVGGAHRLEPEIRHLLQVFVALCVFGLASANLVALALGIAGLAQSERRKLFAILGTVFASLELLLLLLLLLSRR